MPTSLSSRSTPIQTAVFRRLEPFGQEVTGLSVEQITQTQIEDLKRRLAASGVVAVRDQHITDDAFAAFLSQLGPLTFTLGEKALAHCPQLNIVSNVGRKRPPRSVFHTDTSYISQPPAYTALRAIVLPAQGGETLFSNQYRAFETLPNSVKKRLRQAKVHHVATGVTLEETAESQTWHPLFRRHPISQKICLFLSTPERCQQLSDIENQNVDDQNVDDKNVDDKNVDGKNSQRIIRLLYKHSIRSHHVYRHHWKAGDIVIWDDRCTMHRADHSNVVGDRILHRGLVAGEAPVAAYTASD